VVYPKAGISNRRSLQSYPRLTVKSRLNGRLGKADAVTSHTRLRCRTESYQMAFLRREGTK
jgi:hypothetical protein